MDAALGLALAVGIVTLCEALGFSRATFHRRRAARTTMPPMQTSASDTLGDLRPVAACGHGAARRKGSGRRGKAGVGEYPRLREFGLLCGDTPAALCEVARQAAESSSYEQAREALSRRGLHVDEKAIVRLTAALGTLSLQLRTARLAQAPPAASAVHGSARRCTTER